MLPSTRQHVGEGPFVPWLEKCNRCAAPTILCDSQFRPHVAFAEVPACRQRSRSTLPVYTCLSRSTFQHTRCPPRAFIHTCFFQCASANCLIGTTGFLRNRFLLAFLAYKNLPHMLGRACAWSTYCSLRAFTTCSTTQRTCFPHELSRNRAVPPMPPCPPFVQLHHLEDDLKHLRNGIKELVARIDSYMQQYVLAVCSNEV